MLRVLVFFGLLFGAAAGFAWLADLPGTIQISWPVYENGEQVGTDIWEQSPSVVAIVAAALLACFLAVIWIIRIILKSPQIATRFFRQRRKDKGYGALSQGLIALGTGNAKLARRHALEADRLLSEEPAAKLLLAQTAQLAGKNEEARQRFEAMLEDPKTKALGLHGLFVEAERYKEPVAARHYAEEAAKTSPGLEWAGKAVLGYQAVAHHWEAALKTLESNYAAKLLDKKTYRRQRAVILTALAQKLEDGEPERAFSLAKEAHGLALDLVPASVVTSRLATRRGDIRKASKVLEATWRLNPHPELAETYAHVRTGDSAIDRLKRVKSLSAQRANTAEGALAIARAAMEAREFDEARKHLKKVLQSEPTQRAFVLMAELEETEHGDKGRVRDWFSRAVSAPLDKVWIADGVISADWQAVSPVTGKLDAFNWVTPDRLSAEGAPILEDSLFDAPAIAAAVSTTDVETDTNQSTVQTAEVDAVEDAIVVDEPKKASEPSKKQLDVPSELSSKAVDPSEKQGYEGTTDDVKFSPPLNDLPDAAPKEAAAVEMEPSKVNEDATKAADASAEDNSSVEVSQASEPNEQKGEKSDQVASNKQDKRDLNRPIEFALSRMPDDPGPDKDDQDKTSKATRPRFFN